MIQMIVIQVKEIIGNLSKASKKAEFCNSLHKSIDITSSMTNSTVNESA